MNQFQGTIRRIFFYRIVWGKPRTMTGTSEEINGDSSPPKLKIVDGGFSLILLKN